MSRKKKIFFTVILVIVFLVLLEYAAEFLFSKFGDYEKKTTMEAYKLMPQEQEFFRDMEECARQTAAKHSTSYSRYLLFDTPEDCSTPTYNYSNRIRKTWNPDVAITSSTKVVTIGFFGGSTMQGLGAVDDETIPSHFSKLANAAKDGNVYEVTNYGASSYTFTQSLMKLILLLRDGKHFDYVIFYDGTNDIDNAYEAGEVGALEYEPSIRIKLEGTTWQKITDFVKNRVINGCMLCKAALIISRNTPFLRDELSPFLVRLRNLVLFKNGDTKSSADLTPFGQQIADYYKKTHEMLDALSKVYGFKYFDFWQPSLMFSNDPTTGEKSIYNLDPRLTDQKLVALYRETLDDVDSYHLNNFEDLSGEFAGRPHAYYVDAVHVSGEANGVTAAKIYDVFKTLKSKSGTVL